MIGCGLILAAPASGSGKTLVTAGLLRHLVRRGLRVAAAKVAGRIAHGSRLTHGPPLAAA